MTILDYLILALHAISGALLVVTLVAVAARWAIRHYAPADMPDDDGEGTFN